MRITAIWMVILACAASPGIATAQTTSTKPAWDTYSDTWVATDDLGRELPGYDECGPPKANKTVGMFYYLWHDSARGILRDNAMAVAKNPDARFYGPKGEWHWWGEPLLGYYLVSDPFVQRTHAAMLNDAGVDTVVCDVTNAFTYRDQYTALCRAYEQIRSLGQTTPDIAFITHSKTGPTVQKLYDDLYSKRLYSDLWFRWQGKPLLMTKAGEVPESLKGYFSIRSSWAWHLPTGWFGDGKDSWPWIDNYPQQFGWNSSPDSPEELSVAAATHASSDVGRSFHDGQQPPLDHFTSAEDPFFTEQWRQALKVSPQFLFITNFNEWIAQAQHDPNRKQFVGHQMKQGEAYFVDEYDPEFSRDIEPAAPTPANRGLEDNCYYQMVAGIRRYKGVRALPEVLPQSISMTGRFEEWAKVAPEFRDAIGDAVHRNYDGFENGTRYVNQSGRNDIVAAKVSQDAANLYFYVRTADVLSPSTDPDWMVLYIDSDHDAKTGWMGYDFAVNRTDVQDGQTTLQRNVGNRYEWKTITSRIRFDTKGNEMELAIPKSTIGMHGNTATIDFKWADHCYAKGDWTDFTLNGDAAPDGRFKYRAKLRAAAAN
jgi:hypothetical protein